MFLDVYMCDCNLSDSVFWKIQKCVIKRIEGKLIERSGTGSQVQDKNQKKNAWIWDAVRYFFKQTHNINYIALLAFCLYSMYWYVVLTFSWKCTGEVFLLLGSGGNSVLFGKWTQLSANILWEHMIPRIN